MRWLIDGYNVMHAGGRLGPKLGREGFRRARRRFLDDLVVSLNVHAAELVTVVFDASVPPGDFPTETTYHGLHVVFALADESADARIERLIAEDSNPRTLTVISSDRRIRQAAARRRSKDLSAEAFWDMIDDLNERAARHKERRNVAPCPSQVLVEEEQPDFDETAYWLQAFGDLADTPEFREAMKPAPTLLTDAEIAEIQRQVDREP